jgi:hypothetical protein
MHDNQTNNRHTTAQPLLRNHLFYRNHYGCKDRTAEGKSCSWRKQCTHYYSPCRYCITAADPKNKDRNPYFEVCLATNRKMEINP